MNSIQKFLKTPLGLVGGLVIVLLFFLSLFGKYISSDSTEDANEQNIQLQYLKPNTIIKGYIESGKKTFRPIDSFSVDRRDGHCVVRRYHTDIWTAVDCRRILEKHFFLGSDSLGRDIWSRLVLATRYSIFLGLFAVLVSVVFGGILGILAGYYGGWVDRIVSFVIQLFWTIPTTLLAMTMAMGSQTNTLSQWGIIVIAVGLTMWVDIARLLRGLIIQIKNKEYILTTKAIGVGGARTIWIHILPHTIPSLSVMVASNFASAILVESGLSYLGLGIQPPTPSWGGLLREYYHYIGTEFSYLAIFPASFILMSVLAFYFIGNAIRDIYHLRK